MENREALLKAETDKLIEEGREERLFNSGRNNVKA